MNKVISLILLSTIAVLILGCTKPTKSEEAAKSRPSIKQQYINLINSRCNLNALIPNRGGCADAVAAYQFYYGS